MRLLARRGVTFVNGRILGADGCVGSNLRVEGGRLAGLDEAPGRGDLVIDLEGAVLAPGLINAHDHLELNTLPRLKWRDRYANAREWVEDFQPRFRTDPALVEMLSQPMADRLFVGMLKNLLSGVTTVCHHNPMYRPLRAGCPIRVVRRYGFSHSLYIDGAAVARSFRRTPRGWPWIIHAAEGTDATAADEFRRLDELGCIGPRTVLVHGVGLRAPDRARLIAAGGALVWCPGSNDFLFGARAEVEPFARAGRLALGSDSRLSGARDLLAELGVARRTPGLSARALVRAVTADAAAVLRLPLAGRLAVGAPADLAVFRPDGPDPWEALVSCERAEVQLVMVAGQPRVGDRSLRALFETAGVPAVEARLDGVPKLLAQSLARRLAQSAVGEPGLEVS